jgi:hypothetical protein
MERADRHRREAHGRSSAAAESTNPAKSDPDRLLQLLQRHDRLVLGWRGKLHRSYFPSTSGRGCDRTRAGESRRSAGKRLRAFRN